MSINLGEISRLAEYWNEQAAGKTMREILGNDETMVAFANAAVGQIVDSLDLRYRAGLAEGLARATVLGIYLAEMGKTHLLEEKREVQ